MHYIDLSHPFEAVMPVFPGDPAATLKQTLTVVGDGCADHVLNTGMHVGTHIDAPAHMLVDGTTVDSFPLTKTHLRGVVVDARTAPQLDKGIFDRAPIEKDMAVVVATGWSDYFNTPKYYDFAQMPLLTEDAAQYLKEKNVACLILDTPTPDVAPFPQHKILLGAGIYIIENAAHTVSLLGAGAFECIVAPLRFVADAAPARVWARVHGEQRELPRGLYQHYKGHEYEVVDVAQHSETLEYMVVYRDRSNPSLVWTRPLSMFVEMVVVDGVERPRFTYRGE